MNELEHGTIFEKGERNPYGKYFIGQSYLAMLTPVSYTHLTLPTT